MEVLHGHTSPETAYKVDNYPYGFRLRTSIFYWIETTPKKGDRFCSYTINPKNGTRNATKCSTYCNVGFMFLDENNHCHWTGVHIYSTAEEKARFIERVGLENLNKEQRKQWDALNGIVEVNTNEFTGAKVKDFSVKWERETIGAGWTDGVWNKGEPGKYDEVKITFDRPDGVKLIEIFEAMKTLNQQRLNEVFEERPSISAGTRTGVVRICCRGGVYLGTVSEASYREYLASDRNVNAMEAQGV